MSDTKIQFRKGDVVSMRGVVAYSHQLTDNTVTVLVNNSNVYLKAEDLKLEVPAFHKGEEVLYDGHLSTVLAVDGEEVWLRISDDTTAIVSAMTLSPKPEVPAPEAE